MESWKIIEGFENYSVSDHGNVKNNKTGRIKKVKPNIKGYIHISLKLNKVEYKKLVHILVASAFIPNPENKLFVDHIDNNRSNNSVNNLRWATLVQNNQNKELYKNSKSGVKGVFFDKHAKKYRAQITVDGIQIHLGLFANIEDAKQVRIKRANEAFGIFTHSSEKII
jgi:hypothetical protein